MSPLTEGRGLKRYPARPCAAVSTVAPHRGAWIETTRACGARTELASPLTEGRGLKLHRGGRRDRRRGRPSQRGVD